MLRSKVPFPFFSRWAPIMVSVVLFWEERGHVSWARKRAGSERLWPFRMERECSARVAFSGRLGRLFALATVRGENERPGSPVVAAEKISLLRLARNLWWVTYRRRLILADQVVYGAAAKQRQSGGQTPPSFAAQRAFVERWPSWTDQASVFSCLRRSSEVRPVR